VSSEGEKQSLEAFVATEGEACEAFFVSIILKDGEGEEIWRS